MNTDICTAMARALPHEQLPLPEAAVHTYQRFCLCTRCRVVRDTMTDEGKRLERAIHFSAELSKIKRVILTLEADLRQEVSAARAAVIAAERREQDAREAAVRG